jgi:hypothetical protein
MQRMLCVAAAALALLLPTSVEARTPVFARTKCVGLYCWIVTEPVPGPGSKPATWRKGWAPRRAPKAARRRTPQKRSDLLRRAAAIARKHQWCDSKRVAECYDCVCRKEARKLTPRARASR